MKSASKPATLGGLLGNLGIHIIDLPSGRWGFVGTLPAALGDVVLATAADVMGGRAQTNPHDGKAYTIKFPTFESKPEAEAHLAERLGSSPEREHTFKPSGRVYPKNLYCAICGASETDHRL